MNKLLIGLISAALSITPALAGGPRGNHVAPVHGGGHHGGGYHGGYYRPYYGGYYRPYYGGYYNNWYWAAPLIIGGVVGYTAGAYSAEPAPSATLRKDLDGKIFELRTIYVEECRCNRQIWVQIQ